MRRTPSACLVCLLTVTAPGSAISQENPLHSPEREKLLRTFLDEFVQITPGRGKFPRSFSMGSADHEQEQPVHRVTFHAGFSIAKYEVPQNLYGVVMEKNPSRWKGPRNSAEMMTRSEANQFCDRVTRLLRAAGLIGADEVIRLPSEAEWEYCCRAGTTTAFSFGDDATTIEDDGEQAGLLDLYAWHTGNAAGNDPPVGALKPNPWGLYDMHGYLWEYTSDDWHDSYANAPADGASWTIHEGPSARAVIRGGSWKDAHPQLRSASRRPFPLDGRDDTVGFRCVWAHQR